MASDKPFYLSYGLHNVHTEQYATREEADAAAASVPLSVRGMEPWNLRGMQPPRWSVHEEYQDVGSSHSDASASVDTSAPSAPDWSHNPWVGEDGRLL